MAKLRAALDKGFTVLEALIVLVVIGVLTTLVLVEIGGVKEEVYITAMKNDLRNYATAEEQYFHASGDGYGGPDQVESQQGFSYSGGVRADTASQSRDHWYLRVEHADTDVKCELFFSPAQEVPNAPNRIICPGDPLLMPVDVDLATNDIQFTLNDDATYSAKVQQADGAVLDFAVHVRHPNDSTSLLCRKSGPRTVTCSGDIPVEQEGEYTVTAAGAIGGASPSGTGELSARDSVAYEVVNRPPSASFSLSPTEPQTDETVAFDASSSSDPDGTVSDYSWDFGDGATATGATPDHSYSDDGDYTVRLIVTDNLGKQDTTAQTVPVTNRAPTADFTFSPTEPQTDEAIRLDGSTSEDPDGTIPDYRWSFDGGTATAWGTFTIETSFGTDGDHTLALQVRDNDGTVSDWVEKTVTVTNRAPTASFSFSPPSPATNETVNLDGTGSSDPDGSVSSYSWDFGDGTTATGSTPSHSYSDDGDYTVTLTVIDDDGATSSTNQTVTVSNQAPTGSFTFSPSSPTTGETVNFDGTGSSDADGSIESYSWDFGDGTTATGAAPDHSYSDDGDYTVTLTVTDDDGATGSKSQTVTVSNQAPTASFTWSPSSPTTGESVTFDGSGSSDPDGTVDAYSWDFDGDGTQDATGVSPTHTFSSSGPHAVTLTVTDDDGGSDSASDDVSVQNSAPTASFTFSPSSPGTGETVNFDGTGSNDSDGSISSYSWDFGEGSTATGPTPSHSYSDDGDYTVTLTVIDDDGATSSTNQTVTVSNQSPTISSLACDDPKLTDQTITCTAQGSDPDGSIVSWNWGDHYDGHQDTNTSTGSQASRSFRDDGSYTASVVATDDDGATASDSVSVTVDNREPTISSLSCDDPKETGQTVTCTAEASDPDGSIANYNWGNHFNGTKTTGTATPSEAARSFADDGSYTAAVQAKDDDGVWGPWEKQTVTVENQPPSADFNFSPTSPLTNEAVGFDGSNSFDSDGRIDEFRWDLGDGSSGSGETVSHTYDEYGDYDVALTVWDDNGDSATDDTTVSVLQRVPDNPETGISASETSPGEWGVVAAGRQAQDVPLEMTLERRREVSGSFTSWETVPIEDCRDGDGDNPTFAGDGRVFCIDENARAPDEMTTEEAEEYRMEVRADYEGDGIFEVVVTEKVRIEGTSSSEF